MKVFMKRNPVEEGSSPQGGAKWRGSERNQMLLPTELPLADEGLEGRETEGGGGGWRGTFRGNLHILRNISGRLG